MINAVPIRDIEVFNYLGRIGVRKDEILEGVVDDSLALSLNGEGELAEEGRV